MKRKVPFRVKGREKSPRWLHRHQWKVSPILQTSAQIGSCLNQVTHTRYFPQFVII